MGTRLYGAGLAGTLIAALFLPWAHYGGIEVALGRLPFWGLYVLPAVALLVVAGMAVGAGPRRPPGALVVTLAVVTAAGALMVLSLHDEAVGIFGSGPVPMVRSTPGAGGFVAIVAALVTGAAAVVKREPSRAPAAT